MRVGKYFVASEFDCHCRTCTETLIDTRLVAKLDAMREAIGERLVILSGFRCSGRQSELKKMGFPTAKGRSSHQDGQAADVKCTGKTGGELAEIAKAAGFKRMGIALTWLHVDVRAGTASWRYGVE